MNTVKQLRLSFVVLSLLMLSACSGTSQDTIRGNTTLKGSLGVASWQASDLNTQSTHAYSGIDLALLNRILIKDSHGLQTASQEPAIRGLNAAVFQNALAILQNNDARPLFSLTKQSIIAVDNEGNVVATTQIQRDGTWTLELSNQDWQKASTVGLVQGYESDAGWACSKPLEYENTSGVLTPALFTFDEQMTLESQQVLSVGQFNFNAETGNPTSFKQDSETLPENLFQPFCNNSNVIEAQVSADFFWETPENVTESSIYKTGVGYGINTLNTNEPDFIGVAPLSAEGIMDMRISKPDGGEAIPMALVISDAKLLGLDADVDPSSIPMPLTPTFDLNAAIAFGNPEAPRQILVDDEGYAYDPSQTRGGMAQVRGTVLDSQGNASEGAIVIGIIDSDEVIAFNFAITDSNGLYNLLLPATASDLPYFIVALSRDEKEVGRPVNVPPFRNDGSDPRYVIAQATQYDGANIQLQTLGETEEGDSGNISGEVSLASGTLDTAVIKACSVDFSDCSLTTEVNSQSSSAPFTINSVPQGQYVIIAQKDSDGDSSPDLEATYSLSGNEPTLVSPPASNINITLTDQSESSQQSLTILRPEDFSSGTANVTLDELGQDESLVLIAVHGSQDLNTDSLDFSLSVSGVNPYSPSSTLTTNRLVTPLEHEHTWRDNHLEFTQQSEAHLQSLLENNTLSLFEQQEALQTQGTERCAGPYTIGKQCQFYVANYATNQDNSFAEEVEINAQLVQISENAYWFVQNEDLTDFSNSELQQLIDDFETITVPSNKKYFGDFQDIDNNGKIIILFSQLLGSDLLGYVSPKDYFPNDAGNPNSNEADIFYATTPGQTSIYMSRTQFFSEIMPATITHELKHLITLGSRVANPNIPGFNKFPPLWQEEASAVAAEELANQGTSFGYLQQNTSRFIATPEKFRVTYRGRPSGLDGLGIYFYNWLFVWRQAERVGHESYWPASITDPDVGQKLLENLTGTDFADLMIDWALTMLFDNTFLIEDSEYEDLNLKNGRWANIGYQPLQSGSGTSRSIQYFAAKGNNQEAGISITTSNSEPYFVIVRFKGELPW